MKYNLPQDIRAFAVALAVGLALVLGLLYFRAAPVDGERDAKPSFQAPPERLPSVAPAKRG